MMHIRLANISPQALVTAFLVCICTALILYTIKLFKIYLFYFNSCKTPKLLSLQMKMKLLKKRRFIFKDSLYLTQ